MITFDKEAVIKQLQEYPADVDRLVKFLDMSFDTLDKNEFSRLYHRWMGSNKCTSQDSLLTDVFLLSEIDFLSNTEEIFTNTFFNTPIDTIEIPSNIKVIEETAFERSRLYSCVISEGLTHIRSNAFYHCEQLENIVIPKTVQWLGNFVFDHCSSLKEIQYKGTIKQFKNIDVDDLFLAGSSVKRIICSDGVIKGDE